MPKYKPKFPKIVDIQKVNASPYPRKIDLENVEKLKKFERTEVVSSFSELEQKIKERKNWLKKSYS